MPRLQMISAVLQTVFLIACGLVISHNLYLSVEGKFTSNDLYKNWTEAVELAAKNHNRSNQTTLAIGPGAVVISNDTAFNATSTSTSSSNSNESFYLKSLPRDLLVYTIITIMAYYWQIWLERTFPARPRPSVKVVSEKFGDDESREEEVVKKWIAQGKIRRASLSWWNTFVKWALDMVVGGLWMTTVYILLGGLLKMDTSPKALFKGLKWVRLSIPSEKYNQG
ncbi:uncharacterized protein LY89DRAFT_396234 [Mollisia scopiformis]|uniref:Uncharacterized protein n=1 Tax=Mollisia scopiformis TaxID=149040 RepID=A0A194XR61_MOLSC|nr:uncharacterized protein LY89DRAFT_396234 [Mollisia scopiformis]KUJ22217.1 hypothetical protein LY89DRAFT_396234 [Mollisia scopiformis]